MRVWGRIYAEDGSYTWQAVETDADGSNDYVYATNLLQVCKMNPGESPFYSNSGLPGQRAVAQQIPPDYYVALTQQQFAGFFAALVVTKIKIPTPTYRINLTTHQGVQIAAEIPV